MKLLLVIGGIFMSNLTIRGIPSDVLEQIRILSKIKKRSLNSEILLLIEKGLEYYTSENTGSNNNFISKETQVEIWSNLSNKWEDTRETENIIADIYTKRTEGREIEL